MIEFNETSRTYTCPFCGCKQSYVNNTFYMENGSDDTKIEVFHLKCSNNDCGKTTVLAQTFDGKRQWDLIPEVVYRHYPDYIPQQIRDDYVEACLIMDQSPKAAATLLRRCLQGMIRDFHGITKDKLGDAINELQGKITTPLWNAIDGLRKVGNIGAHMEKDVNLIVDIDPNEAEKLKKLIERLLDNWYIARHEEEALCAEIVGISDSKQAKRKGSE